MKEYYKIGEISNLYGIGTDSLRYYEEIGILKPERGDNGYRMYSIRDIRTLNILRELRSIGFSMAEIKDHLSGFDLESTLALFEKEMGVIDDKIRNLTDLREQLEIRTDNIKKNITDSCDADKIELIHLPERKILLLSEDAYRDEELDFVIKKLQNKSDDMLYLIGNGDMGATVPLQSLREGNHIHYSGAFCIMYDGEPYDTLIPEGDYLCCYARGSYSKIPAAWDAFLKEMDHRGLIPDGVPMELYVIDNYDTNNEDEYVTQLQIKCK